MQPQEERSQDPAIAMPLGHSARLPAWLSSVVLHAILFVCVGLLWRAAAPRGLAVEGDRSAGIALADVRSGTPEYFYSSESGRAEASESSSPSSGGLPQSTTRPASDLPGLPIIADSSAGSESATGLPAAGDLTTTGLPGRATGGQTSTGIFGAVGTGSKFVYLFDRSASMGDLGGRPLKAAKSQLIASLENLSDIHQFQIVFYNEQPYVFNPNSPRPARLMYGDDQSKRLAKKFIEGISPVGGTRHWDALKLALNMRPDVIFFLTDGTADPLTRNQLAEIEGIHERSGTSINVIEFGTGPSRSRTSFLTRLAQQNNGQYVYVDVTRLSLQPNHPP